MLVKIEGTEDEIRSLLGVGHFPGKSNSKKRSSQAPSKASPSAKAKPKKKGKPMTRKTQLAINRGRKLKGMKPIKWKKKGK